MRAITAVATNRPEVGVLIDAPASQLPAIASTLSASGVHASFTLEHAPSQRDARPARARRSGGAAAPHGRPRALAQHPRRARSADHPLGSATTSSTPQTVRASASGGSRIGAGGRLVAGAVRVDDSDDSLGQLHAGEVVELTVPSPHAASRCSQSCVPQLRAEHLAAVPVGRLMQDAAREGLALAARPGCRADCAAASGWARSRRADARTAASAKASRRAARAARRP